MPPSTLSPLQVRVLEILAPLRPRWTLTGGGALAGFYLGHRTTRDLDLFWRGEARLGTLRGDVALRLADAGLPATAVHGSDTFQRLRIDDGTEVLVIDLVAEPVPPLEPPREFTVGSERIHVDTEHEMLVNKLCALLSRAELRDLIDTRALLDGGGDLTRALLDAPRKDTGFSPLTLAWLVRDLPIEAMAAAESLEPHRLADLLAFRGQFVERLLRLSKPED